MTSRYVLYVGAALLVVALSSCAPWEWLKEKLGVAKKTEVSAIAVETVGVKREGKPAVVAQIIKPVELQGRGDKVLVRKGDMPIMTLKSFEAEFGQLLEENPQLQQMAQFIPDLKTNVLNGLVGQLVMDVYVADKGLDQSPDYQKDFDRLITSVKRMLNRKYFTQKHPVSVTDAEIKKFYEENKDKYPGLLISAGGVRAVGIKFEKDEAAQTFYEKVKGKSKEFDSIAKSSGLSDKIQDFKLVNDQSVGINDTLRSKVVALRRFPTVEMVKVSGNEIWVINASDKEEKKYRPFDEVKEYLKNDIEREKEMKVVEGAIENLKKEYDIVIDEEVANVLKPEKSEEVAEISQEPKAEMPKTTQAPKTSSAEKVPAATKTA